MTTDKAGKTETIRAAGVERSDTIQRPDELRKRVEAALAQVRPYLQGDGGDVELVEIDEPAKTVKVRLTGGCGCCPSAGLTLKNEIEATIKKNAPEIKSVEAV